MPSFDETLRLYDYALPPELIAQVPASPRDSAKLLVYRRETGETTSTVFREIGEFLPPRALLILNRTKVIPARMPLLRESGGSVEALFLGMQGETMRVLAPKKLRVGEVLYLGSHTLTVRARDEQAWLLDAKISQTALACLLDEYGKTPLPPYIKHSPLTESQRRSEYQSVFARDRGSIAAPTASLHFTRRLLTQLRARGIETASVTLHVHLGTFAPLTAEQWASGHLHREEYRIPAATIAAIRRAKEDGRSIIAVGTTVVRTLESACDEHGALVRSSGDTQLFIREGFRFRVVDGIITNFHVPRSSLLMLVSAFAGLERMHELYQRAIAEHYRFFSFGDAMLLL